VPLQARNGRIPAAGPVQVGVRPQDFHLNAPEPGWPGISGEVMLYEPLGTKGVLTLRCGDHRIRLLTPIRASFRRGENVRAWLDPTRLKLFDVDSAPATRAAEDLGAGMPAR
jgi:ABC-type sugar transport system ATPase subunit